MTYANFDLSGFSVSLNPKIQEMTKWEKKQKLKARGASFGRSAWSGLQDLHHASQTTMAGLGSLLSSHGNTLKWVNGHVCPVPAKETREGPMSKHTTTANNDMLQLGYLACSPLFQNRADQWIKMDFLLLVCF